MTDNPPARRIAVVGTEGACGRRLAERYAALGNDVARVAAQGRTPEAIVAELGDGPIDALVFADGYPPRVRDLSAVARPELQAGLERMAFLPFRVANLLHPRLSAQAGGKLVLLSRTDARMDRAGTIGRYLDRPFRAAAHSLWRCLSIEWRTSGVQCLIIALDDPDNPEEVERLPAVIASARRHEDGVRLLDSHGNVLSW